MSYPYWMRRAHRNPHALAPIVYFPKDIPRDSAYTRGAHEVMVSAQEWYYRIAGKTFRRLSVVNVLGELTTHEFSTSVFDNFRAILMECERRGVRDGSEKTVSKCGLGDARGYVIFVPGPVHVGNMVGFEHPCGTHTKPPNANPLWPRPGMTGLSHKGMELVSGKQVKYAEQAEWYNPATGTYKHEWFAATAKAYTSAIIHEVGHILNLPHPQDCPICKDLNGGDTVMWAWWDAKGLLPHEKEVVRANLLMR